MKLDEKCNEYDKKQQEKHRVSGNKKLSISNGQISPSTTPIVKEQNKLIGR